MSRLTSKTYPDGSKVTYQYENTISRLHSILDAMGQETIFGYNVADQLTGVSYQNAVNPTPNVAFSYEPVLGRLAGMTDGSGQTSFGYNPIVAGPGAGRLGTVQGPLASSAVRYGYDASGRVTSVGVNGVAESYTYNPYGQLAQVSNPLGVFGYSYDSAGRLSQVSLPNGASTALSYYPTGESGRLEQITHSGALGLLAQYGYSYDPAGQITKWSIEPGGGAPMETRNPSYDPAGQLIGDIETLGTTTTTQSWSYDLAGNRTQATWNGIPTNATANALNQLTQVSPAKLKVAGQTNVSATVTVNGVTATGSAGNGFWTYVAEGQGVQELTVTAQNGSSPNLTQHYQVVNGATLRYDLNGNLINDGKFQYSWDAANRLIQITTLNPTPANPAHVSEFRYDGLWRRVEDREYAGVDLVEDRRFIWAGAEIKEERDQNNNVVKRFYGSGVQVVQGPLGGVYLYTRDHLGSVRGVLDGAGNQVAAYDYDVWGNRTQTAGTFVADFGYAGYFEHAPSGLKLTWFRGYSPLLGRWISRDPLGEVKGGMNLYGYVGNLPTSLIDWWGLCSIVPGGLDPANDPYVTQTGSGLYGPAPDFTPFPPQTESYILMVEMSAGFHLAEGDVPAAGLTTLASSFASTTVS